MVELDGLAADVFERRRLGVDVEDGCSAKELGDGGGSWLPVLEWWLVRGGVSVAVVGYLKWKREREREERS